MNEEKEEVQEEAKAGSRGQDRSGEVLRYLHHSPDQIPGLQAVLQELKGRSSWTTIPVLWQQVLAASSAVSPARADRWHRQLG